MSDRLRIAILDDVSAHARAAAQELESMGFEVRAATTLIEFEQMMDGFSPQIILTDVQMPELSGDLLCKVLKRDYASATTPVILYSGLDEEQLSRLAKRSGADGFICKDWGPDELRRIIGELSEEMVF